MGVLDFLFDGSPPKSVNNYGTTTANIPQWLSDYTQGLISKQNEIAAQGYQAYQGPRVAPFTTDQNNAFNMVRSNVGDYQPALDQATTATQGALTSSQPYFAAAGQSTPSAIQGYLNPYMKDVTDQGTRIAMQNFNEKILPGIDDRFIGSGQSGSSANLDKVLQASRDVTDNIQQNANAQLAQGYNSSAAQFASDAARNAQLGTSVGNLNLNTASGLNQLAQSKQALGLTDEQTLQASGQQQQQNTQQNYDTAYGDFNQQRAFPTQAVTNIANLVQGLPRDTTTQTTSTGPANVYQPSPLSQVLAAYGAYKDFTTARDGGRIRKPKEFALGGLASLRMPRFAGGTQGPGRPPFMPMAPNLPPPNRMVRPMPPPGGPGFVPRPAQQPMFNPNVHPVMLAPQPGLSYMGAR